MAKIFYRERTRVQDGDQQPRWAVVGMQGTDLNLIEHHLRKSELEAIAREVGAELVQLPKGIGNGNGQGQGKKKKGAKKKNK